MFRKFKLSLVVCLFAASALVFGGGPTAEQMEQLKKVPLDKVFKELKIRELNRQFAEAVKDPEATVFGNNPVLAPFDDRQLVDKVNKTIVVVNAKGKTIHIVDDRQNVCTGVPETVKKNAQSVVAVVPTASLTKLQNGSWKLATTSYKSKYGLCTGERFENEVVGAFCTGFLVAPDVIATAGHCVKNLGDKDPYKLALLTENASFVFGFQTKADCTTIQTEFGADDVYHAAEIIGRECETDGPDWALVKLDRPVANGNLPLKIRSTGQCQVEDPVYVLGHPSGLPLKFAPNAEVLEVNQSSYFKASLDTFHGNSGSPVFSAKTHEVEGILVRGGEDYYLLNNTCNTLFVCERDSTDTKNCSGESVVRSLEYAALLNGWIKRSNVEAGGTSEK